MAPAFLFLLSGGLPRRLRLGSKDLAAASHAGGRPRRVFALCAGRSTLRIPAQSPKIRSVEAPVLVVSGTADTLTPKWMADKLFAQAHQPKQLYMVPDAGHVCRQVIGIPS
jgi:fermentation-respiration switch protein FrsA (DUF1100 family)